MSSLLRLVFLSIFRVLTSQTWVHKQGTRRRVSLYIRHGDKDCLQSGHVTEDGPALLILLPLFIRCWDYCVHLHALCLQCQGSNSVPHVCQATLYQQSYTSRQKSLRSGHTGGGSFMQRQPIHANGGCGDVDTLMHTVIVGGVMVSERLLCLQQTDHSLDPFHVCLTPTSSDHMTGTYLIRSS